MVFISSPSVGEMLLSCLECSSQCGRNVAFLFGTFFPVWEDVFFLFGTFYPVWEKRYFLVWSVPPSVGRCLFSVWSVLPDSRNGIPTQKENSPTTSCCQTAARGEEISYFPLTSIISSFSISTISLWISLAIKWKNRL